MGQVYGAERGEEADVNTLGDTAPMFSPRTLMFPGMCTILLVLLFIFHMRNKEHIARKELISLKKANEEEEERRQAQEREDEARRQEEERRREERELAAAQRERAAAQRE